MSLVTTSLTECSDVTVIRVCVLFSMQLEHRYEKRSIRRLLPLLESLRRMSKASQWVSLCTFLLAPKPGWDFVWVLTSLLLTQQVTSTLQLALGLTCPPALSHPDPCALMMPS